MNTITCMLSLVDGMSGPLSKMGDAVDAMVKRIERLQEVIGQGVEFDASFEEAKKQVVDAGTLMAEAIGKAADAQQDMNDAVKKQIELAAQAAKTQASASGPESNASDTSSASDWDNQSTKLYTGLKAFAPIRLGIEVLGARKNVMELKSDFRQMAQEFNKTIFLPENAQADLIALDSHINKLQKRVRLVGAGVMVKKLFKPTGIGDMNTQYQTLRNQMAGVQAQKNGLITDVKANDLGGAGTKYKALVGSMAEVDKHIKENIKGQSNHNKKIKEGEASSNALANAYKKITTFLNGAVVKKIGEMALGGAMEQQKTKDLFIARTGNVQTGSAVFEQLKADAKKAGLDVNSTLQGSLALFDVTQNSGQLTQLSAYAQRLSAFDVTGGGVAGASTVLKEAMSGNMSSLTEKFKIPASAIQEMKLEDLAKSGNIDGFITKFDELLEKQNMGKEAFDAMMNSPVKQLDMLKNNVNTAFADAGGSAIQAILPALTTLNEAFQSGKFQPFFDALNIALYVVSSFIGGLVEAALGFIDTFRNNLPAILPFLIAIGAVIAVFLIGALWSMVAPILAQAAAWMLAYWPIVLIIVIIGLVVKKVMDAGVTIEQILGTLGSIIGAVLGVVFNTLVQVYNIIMTVAEALANAFTNPVYTVKKLFVSLLDSVLGLIQGVLDALDVITGTKWGEAAKSMRAGMQNWLGEKPDGYIELKRMEEISVKDWANKGESIGSGITGALSNALDGFSMDNNNLFSGWNNNLASNTYKVEDVNKKDGSTVDLSTEDMKTMRDLAEMKNIQNFVTLTPTVSVQTGDINNGYDIQTIVNRITESLEKEIAMSAQGVYA